MLAIHLRIVIVSLTIELSQTPILFLQRRYIALKVLGEAEIASLVEWLRIQTWKEEKAWCWAMICIRP